jgi:hypothetical protein
VALPFAQSEEDVLLKNTTKLIKGIVLKIPMSLL